jgi:hypothetical protein
MNPASLFSRRSALRAPHSAIAALLLLLLIPNFSFAAKPAPPLPPVRYQIQYWDVPSSNGFAYQTDMNHLGQVTGWYQLAGGEKRAYLYDPTVNVTTAIDLTSAYAAGLPAGWVVSSAVGINDQGVIVGYLAPEGSPSHTPVRQGFLLDTLADTPQIMLLPDWGLTYTYPKDINERGDILGVFKSPTGVWSAYFWRPGVDPSPTFLNSNVYNPDYLRLSSPAGSASPIVGGQLTNRTPFRWTPGGALQTISGHSSSFLYDMNDAGTFCGSGVTGRPARSYPMRLTGTTPTFLTSAPVNSAAISINNSGDVIYSESLHRTDWGYLDLNKLVTGSTADLQDWNAATQAVLSHMNDRGALTNFGQIAGRLQFSNGTYAPFLLVPVPAP